MIIVLHYYSNDNNYRNQVRSKIMVVVSWSILDIVVYRLFIGVSINEITDAIDRSRSICMPKWQLISLFITIMSIVVVECCFIIVYVVGDHWKCEYRV